MEFEDVPVWFEIMMAFLIGFLFGPILGISIVLMYYAVKIYRSTKCKKKKGIRQRKR